jgi:ArsR family transcriptional regulator, arsenate/arsenite/antimonite-responsive transcriptional repressor
MTLDPTCSRFAALSDPIRLRLMALLHREGELCVCEMTHALAIPQPKASKHLAALRDAGLVRMRRDAQWVLYAVAEDAGPWLVEVLAATARELVEDPDLERDRSRLHGMRGRPERCRAA